MRTAELRAREQKLRRAMQEGLKSDFEKAQGHLKRFLGARMSAGAEHRGSGGIVPAHKLEMLEANLQNFTEGTYHR